MFLGEERQGRTVATAEELEAAHRELPMGQGWGQRLEGSAEELRQVDAMELEGGEWVFEAQRGLYLDCRVLP